MNKWILCMTVAVVLIVGFYFKPVNTLKEQPLMPENVNKQKKVSLLTQAEENDLKKLIPQSIKGRIFREESEDCSTSKEIIEINFMKNIQDYVGQEIEMKLNIFEDKLTVSLDSLHLFLKFSRLHGLGLSATEYNTFCEDSYEQFLKERNFEPIPPLSNTNSSDKETMPLSESRTFFVDPSLADIKNTGSEWNIEKEQIYNNILDIIRNESQFYCKNRKSVSALIPDFYVGDSDIAIIFEGFKSNDRPGIIIVIERDKTNGKYKARFGKSFGDSIEETLPLIKKRLLRRVTTNCKTD